MEFQQSTNPFHIIYLRLKSIEDILSRMSSRAESVETSQVKYYTIAEAAKKLGVAKITLYRNCAAGKIPCKKIGTRTLIPESFVNK